MQNFNTRIYLKDNKVINIKSEILCREAEDDFFYFNKINSAYKKLREAVKLTPSHTKSIILLADICFIKGYIKKALNLYLKANEIIPLNVRIISAVANCYKSLNEYENAVKFCDMALKTVSSDNLSLLLQIYEIKIFSLINQKKYIQAFYLYTKTKNILTDSIKINYNFLKDKIKLQKKVKQSKLKII